MCFKIANERQAFYKAWHLCKKCLSLRIWFFISLFFWTSDTAHLSLVTLDHISPQKQNRRQQDRLAFFLPKDFKGRSLMPHSWGAKSPCQPLSTFLKLPMPKENPEQWPKHSDSLYLSLLLSPVRVCPISQQKPLLWGTALLKKHRLNTHWFPVTLPRKAFIWASPA